MKEFHLVCGWPGAAADRLGRRSLERQEARRLVGQGSAEVSQQIALAKTVQCSLTPNRAGRGGGGGRGAAVWVVVAVNGWWRRYGCGRRVWVVCRRLRQVGGGMAGGGGWDRRCGSGRAWAVRRRPWRQWWRGTATIRPAAVVRWESAATGARCRGPSESQEFTTPWPASPKTTTSSPSAAWARSAAAAGARPGRAGRSRRREGGWGRPDSHKPRSRSRPAARPWTHG